MAHSPPPLAVAAASPSSQPPSAVVGTGPRRARAHTQPPTSPRHAPSRLTCRLAQGRQPRSANGRHVAAAAPSPGLLRPPPTYPDQSTRPAITIRVRSQTTRPTRRRSPRSFLSYSVPRMTRAGASQHLKPPRTSPRTYAPRVMVTWPHTRRTDKGHLQRHRPNES